MRVETFEWQDDTDLKTAPDWIQDSVENYEKFETVKLPLLIDELVKYKIFNSKSEARSMLSNRGVAIFSFEGKGPMFKFEGENYKTVDGDCISNFNDKRAVITDPTLHWLFIEGDVVKIGKRRFIKIVGAK